jgi:aspartyl/asparaginyl-tRNA synthetase
LEVEGAGQKFEIQVVKLEILEIQMQKFPIQRTNQV